MNNDAALNYSIHLVKTIAAYNRNIGVGDLRNSELIPLLTPIFGELAVKEGLNFRTGSTDE